MAVLLALSLPAGARSEEACSPLLQHQFASLNGSSENLCDFRGKVLLIVNTATLCGFTSQYAGLEALYRKYRDSGFVVLGFPSNDFGKQEPGGNKEIASFCERTFQVSFPLFEKVIVRGPNANPLYRDLAKRSGTAPQWNFHKYLVDRTGSHVTSFGSSVDPESATLITRIESLLAPSTAQDQNP